MNCTLLIVNTETKTKEQIESFFGNGLYSINEVTHYNNFNYDIPNTLSSLADSGTQSQLEEFMKTFNPEVIRYSDRSYLLKMSNKSFKKTNNFPFIFESSELKAPLYWNNKLNGWITSLRNENMLEKYINNESQTKTLPLDRYTFSNYKKGLLLTCEDLDLTPQKYYHGGYWNELLSGWVFRTHYKTKLLDLGAVEV